jgi:lambda repressor-like predicted transcriptional regulator
MVTRATNRNRQLNASRSRGYLFLRARLLERGFSLDGLSKSLGRSRTGLRKGLQRGTPWAIKAVAEALGISIRRCRSLLQIDHENRPQQRKRA